MMVTCTDYRSIREFKKVLNRGCPSLRFVAIDHCTGGGCTKLTDVYKPIDCMVYIPPGI